MSPAAVEFAIPNGSPPPPDAVALPLIDGVAEADGNHEVLPDGDCVLVGVSLGRVTLLDEAGCDFEVAGARLGEASTAAVELGKKELFAEVVASRATVTDTVVVGDRDGDAEGDAVVEPDAKADGEDETDGEGGGSGTHTIWRTTCSRASPRKKRPLERDPATKDGCDSCISSGLNDGVVSLMQTGLAAPQRGVPAPASRAQVRLAR